MIIVEGPDGSGKSRLVKRLQEESGYDLVPRSVSKDAKSLVALDDYVDDQLAMGFGPRIYDRFALISSPCYAMLPGRTFTGRFMDLDWLKAKHHQMQKINPLIIMCLPSLETVKGNTRVGVHDGLDLTAQIEEIYIHYMNFTAGYVHNTSLMVWDYHNPNHVRLGNLMGWAKARIERGQ